MAWEAGYSIECFQIRLKARARVTSDLRLGYNIHILLFIIQPKNGAKSDENENEWI